VFIFVGISVLTAGLARKRKQAESRAAQTQRWMASIVESSDDAVLTKDKNGVITSWNPGAERLYGYSSAEAVGQSVSMLVPPGEHDQIRGFIERLWRGESIDHHPAERLRKDGSRILVDLCLSPVRNERGEVIGACSIAHDITLQHRAEEALRRNEKLATAGRLAAAVAHEINNPLESVTNLLYLVRECPDRAAEFLDLADKEVQRIAEVAQQMLGFVHEPSVPASLNVAENIDQVLQLYLDRLSRKKIRVEKHYEGDPQINGFAGELRQLFSNLILNAVDAMGTGGRLVIHVARAHAWGNGQRPGVRVTVADNGSGIAQCHMPRIFEPFYTTKADLGTGLGLWISQAIVQKHGGSIRVRSRSTPGASGTVFSVFLPESLGRAA
jgi:two-component system CheB/CheR fusion protein